MGCASSTARDDAPAGGGGFTDLDARGGQQAATQQQRTTDAQRTKYGSNGGATSAASTSAVSLAPSLHSDIVFCVSRGSGSTFFAGGEDRSISWFNSAATANPALDTRAKAHERAVSDLAYIESGGRSHLFSGSRDRVVKQWSVPDHTSSDHQLTLLQSFTGHSLPVSCVDVNTADANQLASGARDYQLRFWDVSRGSCLFWTEIQQNVITDLSWIPGEQTVLQASEDLSLRVWDVRTREAVQTFSVRTPRAQSGA